MLRLLRLGLVCGELRGVEDVVGLLHEKKEYDK